MPVWHRLQPDQALTLFIRVIYHSIQALTATVMNVNTSDIEFLKEISVLKSRKQKNDNNNIYLCLYVIRCSSLDPNSALTPVF